MHNNHTCFIDKFCIGDRTTQNHHMLFFFVLIADSKNIPASKKKDFVIAFSKAIRVFCPQSYIAAPDMYMGEQEMALFAETVARPEVEGIKNESGR